MGYNFLPCDRVNYLPSGAYVEIDGIPFPGMARSLTYKVNGLETSNGDS